MGAGLGPATAFLYSGPAVNVLAIILTARVLGFELGVARAIGAIVFSIVIGLCMHLLFRHEKTERPGAAAAMSESGSGRPLWKTALYFASMVGILVFSNLAKPAANEGLWHTLHSAKWVLTALSAAALALMLVTWFGVGWWKVSIAALPPVALALLFPGVPLLPFAAGVVGLSVLTGTSRGETGDWFTATWDFAKQIIPLLLFGVLVAGALLGRPEHEGLIPSSWVARALGGNSLRANFFASVAGALMYFATLTEVPIVQGLMGAGMGKGPALALLLAGPALSLPNMLVIRSVLGTKKTLAFVALVVIMATVTGVIFGTVVG
jgi:uncharacterized membrane protein YraQ (UPF0718 family)